MGERLEATATWLGGWATDVQVRQHTVRVDEREDVGGEDTGPMPTELFCASLASCFCLAVSFAARKRDIVLPELTVSVRAERAGKELRYERFEVDTSAAVDDDVLSWLVNRARPLCWVSNTLDAGVAVEYLHTSLDARFRK
jgi:uncharacterized OsmC-like protein